MRRKKRSKQRTRTMETSETIEFSAQGGARLDKLIAEQTELSRSAAAKLIEQGMVTVNGAPAQKKTVPEVGAVVAITLPEPQPCDILPENIPLEIVYEDSDLLVVNKPKGMVVHPAAGHYSGTLVNALMYHCGSSLSGINGEIRPGIVHRIDKDTSGLLMVAKNDAAHLGLSEQIKAHSFLREYEAVAVGAVKEDGTVNAPIGRHKTDRKRMCVTTENSREAVTHYFVLERFAGYTHLRLRLETGRTHQIRVHMAYIGHALAGDEVYGSGKPKWLGGQCLHARKLGFVHPVTGEYMEFDSGLPEYFTKYLDELAKL
ncbi:MAG: RluA family pseudouridine synthase [Oscillospiraceae bacterium]